MRRVCASRDVEFRLGQLLNAHVLEGHNVYGTDETRWMVDIPHLRVSQFQFEMDVPAHRMGLHIHLIAQVEVSFRFDNVFE